MRLIALYGNFLAHFRQEIVYLFCFRLFPSSSEQKKPTSSFYQVFDAVLGFCFQLILSHHCAYSAFQHRGVMVNTKRSKTEPPKAAFQMTGEFGKLPSGEAFQTVASKRTLSPMFRRSTPGFLFWLKLKLIIYPVFNPNRSRYSMICFSPSS